MGSIYDVHGRVYSEFTHSADNIPSDMDQLLQVECKPFKRLASTIQKYGHMYYHFVLEVLPRFILLRPYLDDDTKILIGATPRFILLRPYLDDDTKILMFGAPPLHPSIPSPLLPFTPLPPTEVLPRFILLRPYLDDDTKILMFGASYQAEVLPRIILLKPCLDDDTKILMFGAPYEAGWLELLNISLDRVEVYDPTATYCADELLLPNPSHVITPAKEGILMLRDTFAGAEPLPEHERNVIIYCSRYKTADRMVSNEAEIIASLKGAYPDEKVVVFTGSDHSVTSTIELFRRAKVVVGMHGAGLSHMIFSAPGTAVVEFLFMYDPPMMFWHASGALGLRYVMVPLAQSWWLDPTVHVPGLDVIDALAIALNKEDPTGCGAGSVRDLSGTCRLCPAGMYRSLAGSEHCSPCEKGRVAPDQGAAFCSTCPTGTITLDGLTCDACPVDKDTLFPGSYMTGQCLSQDQLATIQDSMFSNNVLAKKLVSIPALTMKAQQLHNDMGTWGFHRKLHAAMGLGQLQTSKFHMLDELFNADQNSPEVGDQLGDEPEDNQGQQPGRRGLLQYNIGRQLASYGGGRRLSAYGSRQLLSYSGRQLASYGSRRHLHQQASYGRRSLLSYSSRIANFGARKLSDVLMPFV
eukprot:gene21392-28347_t